jgi:hypothetical protein
VRAHSPAPNPAYAGSMASCSTASLPPCSRSLPPSLVSIGIRNSDASIRSLMKRRVSISAAPTSRGFSAPLAALAALLPALHCALAARPSSWNELAHSKTHEAYIHTSPPTCLVRVRSQWPLVLTSSFDCLAPSPSILYAVISSAPP